MSIENVPPFGPAELKSFLKSYLRIQGEKLEQIHKMFITFEQDLVEYNNKINLISHNDIKNIWTRHILDSIIPLQLFTKLCTGESENLNAIDVGSGAGFPGMALSIVMSNTNFTLVESVGKKAAFLQEMREKFSSQNLRILTERSELLAMNKEHREAYDYSFTRALAKPPTALELLIPFLKKGGLSFFWGSGEEWKNVDALNRVASILGARIADIKNYKLPMDDRDRSIIVFEKISNTMNGYPRNVGVPDKNPLK